MRRTISRLLPAFALCGAALVGCVNNEAGKGTTEGPGKDPPVASPGVTVTEVRAPELVKAIKDQKGKVILIDCWALWCPPCVKGFPHLVERHKKYAAQGLVCMSVSMDKFSNPSAYSKEKVLTFLTEKGATFPNFVIAEPKLDEEALLKLLGDFSGIPYMTLFDRNGRRVWASDELPRLTDEQLDKKIETLLADKP
jgi:thiol-disulfide isomerase/thioredoxin